MLILELNKEDTYIKPNYSAWSIKESEFPTSGSDTDKLIFFCNYAILSPSGHNSQPWLINIQTDSITLSINKDHYISGDKSGLLSVEPYVSLGAFIETLSFAAEAFGYKLSIDYSSDDSSIATFKINSKIPSRPELLTAITSRVSNRFPFKNEEIDKKVLKQLTSHNFASISVRTVTSSKDKAFLGDMTKRAIKSIMSKPKYRQELAEWVRTNTTKKYDGMPGFTHGINLTLSIIAKYAVRYASKHGPQAEKSKDLIIKSGAIIIMS